MLLTLLRTAAPARRLATQPAGCLRTLTTAASELAAQIPSKAATTTTKAAAKPTVKPPYLVGRTPSNNLAVYQLAKRGGNYKLTVVKKIDGDKQALKRDIMQELGLEEDKVRVKTVTGHLELRGHLAPRVTEFLESKGF
ncbi:mitochondrial large subunit ribosomal protein-domain-containing protein [Cercophora newfieldiana]|uniref:Large ribosomal subunit protein mL49 n=1 Tax=Cercophora newfieldiana TaxID=92897 RepID=A0AA39YD49_9PEZI|nr:mitochondrial large subunit ribosomal protein-domain-containing protein [Cercophora newfieldiana]